MTRNTNFFRYFFTRRPVSFLAGRALAELLEFDHGLTTRLAMSGYGGFLSPATRSALRGLHDPGRFGMPRNHLNY